MASLKGPGAPQKHDGSSLRVGIVHARWNSTMIDALLDGCKKSLFAAGVKEENIVIESVPGSYELPYAVQRFYSASQIQSATSTITNTANGLISTTADLLGASASSENLQAQASQAQSSESSSSALKTPFDAVIAIGVLIKGETMHFEYIADAVSHGLMRVQLDTGAPVVFGLLTVLNEEQGLMRAGIGSGEKKGHNHGEDWGSAAVELGIKRKAWAEGRV